MNESLRRLINVECRVMPTMKPFSVFLQKLNTHDFSSSPTTDAEFLDFLSFRAGTDKTSSSNNLNPLTATAQTSFTPPMVSSSVWPPRRSTSTKKFIMFCDSSILLNRQLSQLQAAAAAAAEEDSTSPVLSFVFPFSSLLLLRMQAAQADTVSNAFRVSVFSQMRQLGHFGHPQRQKKQEEKPSCGVPPVCVLPPSFEMKLLRSVNVAGLPDQVLGKSLLSGEAIVSAFLLPRLALAAQREFGAEEGKSCVAAVGSTHTGVHSVCMKSGILCDSLAANSGGVAAAAVGSGGGEDASSSSSERRRAAAQCRLMVKKLQSVAPEGKGRG